MGEPLFWGHGLRKSKKPRVIKIYTRSAKPKAIDKSLDALFGKSKAKKVGWTNQHY